MKTRIFPMIIFTLIFLGCLGSGHNNRSLSEFLETKLDLEKINKFDADSLKSGYWLSEDNRGLNYYYKGRLYGVSFSFSQLRDNDMYYCTDFCGFTDNRYSNFMVYFYPQGNPSAVICLSKNVDFISEHGDYSKEFEFPYQGYCRNYSETGDLESEGWMIFGEDAEIDFVKVGQWFNDLLSNGEFSE